LDQIRQHVQSIAFVGGGGDGGNRASSLGGAVFALPFLEARALAVVALAVAAAIKGTALVVGCRELAFGALPAFIAQTMRFGRAAGIITGARRIGIADT